MKSDKISILLAVYQGERFIEKQIDSIINQTHHNWELFIRDDCSTDATMDIVRNYAVKDDRIRISDNGNTNLGACQNFSKLMEAIPSNSPYIMFCDQDDIWLPEKIEHSLIAIQSLEKEFGDTQNLMAYGTYQMIDESENILPISILDYSSKPEFNLILSQNYIYGCTMIINRILLINSCPIPLTAENHDYWVVLTALANNAHFNYINKPLILYRQHSNNVSGSYVNSFFINRIKRLFGFNEVASIQNRLKMFNSLYEINKSKMTKENLQLLKSYIENVKSGGIKALFYCIKSKIRRLGLMQTMFFYVNILRTPKSGFTSI